MDLDQHLLAAYIRRKYGERQLGLLRLLLRCPYFIDLLKKSKNSSDLLQGLGMPLLSAEKYIRERHGVYYTKTGNTFAIQRTGGGRLYFIEDDPLSTVGGAVVDRVIAVCGSAGTYHRTPMVTVGVGNSISNYVNYINAAAIRDNYKNIKQHFNPEYEQLLNDYDSDVAILEEKIEDTYRFVELTHRGYVEMRKAGFMLDGVTEEECPAASTEGERLSFLMGTGHNYSGFARVAPAMLEMLQGMYPTGRVVDGIFKNFKKIDPYVWIGSSYVEIPTEEEMKAIVSQTAGSETLGPRDEAQIEVNEKKPVKIGNCADVQVGITHVDKWKCKDINNLPPEQSVEALFGNSHLKDLYLTISRGKRSAILKHAHIPGGKSSPDEIISLMGDFLKDNIAEAITDREVYLLAGARIIACKGQFKFYPGSWDFKKVGGQ